MVGTLARDQSSARRLRTERGSFEPFGPRGISKSRRTQPEQHSPRGTRYEVLPRIGPGVNDSRRTHELGNTEEARLVCPDSRATKTAAAAGKQRCRKAGARENFARGLDRRRLSPQSPRTSAPLPPSAATSVNRLEVRRQLCGFRRSVGLPARGNRALLESIRVP